MNDRIVDGFIGLANIEKQQGNVEGYFHLLEMAFLKNNENPNLMLLLAEHYLYKGDYSKAQKLAVRGLIQQKKFKRIIFQNEKKRREIRISQN